MKVVLFSAYDWQGLYIDGELIHEGHSLDVYDVLNAVKKRGTGPIQSLEEINEKGDWLADYGYLPNSVEELVKLNGGK